MPIPQDILSVPRPKNTVVIAYGKDKSLYAVRQRIGCRNDNGRHLPVNGPTIGHIIDGVYVPIDKEAPDSVSASSVDLKDWANVVLCDRLFSDIRKELSAVYSQTDVMKMYCISILRVCDPGVKNYELKEVYETSFLSELYPGIALSKNTVSTFLNDMGKSVSKIVRFMQNRAAAVSMDHHLLIDGTLKSDESRVNSLSDFSRKARTKGTRDISVLYAFDLEAMEPVCSKCFPGNMLDATSYSAFISENRITSLLNGTTCWILPASFLDMKGSPFGKKSVPGRINGFTPTVTAIRHPKRNGTGCAGQRRTRPTALKRSGKSRRPSERSFWNATWIFLPRLLIKPTKSAGRSRSS